MKERTLQTVVEVPEFIRQAEKLMDETCRKELIDFIAMNPTVGDIMIGTGGARKLRWKDAGSKGKRGGLRVIYYYHDQTIPIFLFTIYGKNTKANVSQAERNTLKIIIKQIVKAYGGNNDE